MEPVAQCYLELDEQGRAWIIGANRKVVEVAGEHRYWGWDAATIHENHSDLSLAEIHAALCYYYANKARLDDDMDETARWAAEMRAAVEETPGHRKLRERGLIPARIQ